MPTEDRVWEGAVSQFDNIHVYLICVALCVVATSLPADWALALIATVLSIALWFSASIRKQRCLLTTRRLVFHQPGEELAPREIELSRIREVKHLASAFGLLNLGRIELVLSNGATHISPTLHGARDLHKHLCTLVKGCKGCHASLFPHQLSARPIPAP